MFAKAIIDSDAFLDMPLSTQCLYFHLSMRADDDGFVNNPRKIQKMIGASDDDMKILVMKRYILTFESGIIVIKHWKIHNYIQTDRYKPTTYVEEKAQLSLDGKKSYIECIQNVSSLDTQVSIGKDNIEIGNKEEIYKEEKHRYGTYKRIVLTDKQYENLCSEFGKDYIDFVIDRLDEYVQMTDNKNKYKDFNLVIRKAIKNKWSILNENNKKEVFENGRKKLGDGSKYAGL